MHFKIFTLLALVASMPAFGISLESAVQTALSNNRDLQAAHYAVWKAKGRLAQAGKWPANSNSLQDGGAVFVSRTAVMVIGG
ncbi:MAG: hypothetical protein ACKOLA_00925 [Spartobacteria bacterium]